MSNFHKHELLKRRHIQKDEDNRKPKNTSNNHVHHLFITKSSFWVKMMHYNIPVMHYSDYCQKSSHWHNLYHSFFLSLLCRISSERIFQVQLNTKSSLNCFWCKSCVRFLCLSDKALLASLNVKTIAHRS